MTGSVNRPGPPGAHGADGVRGPDSGADVSDDDLIARALAAQARAYAPYSRYPVGAALIASAPASAPATAPASGPAGVPAGVRIIDGANVENASYGLTLCAERVAAATAAAAGLRAITKIAVATPSTPPVAPCGMCLQTLIEFCADPAGLAVILVNPAGDRRDLTLAQLLPHGFTRDQLAASVSDTRTDGA